MDDEEHEDKATEVVDEDSNSTGQQSENEVNDDKEQSLKHLQQ